MCNQFHLFASLPILPSWISSKNLLTWPKFSNYHIFWGKGREKNRINFRSISQSLLHKLLTPLVWFSKEENIIMIKWIWGTVCTISHLEENQNTVQCFTSSKMCCSKLTIFVWQCIFQPYLPMETYLAELVLDGINF